MRPVGEQVIVITGGSSGIGRATAIAAGRQGAKVVLAGRGADALEAAGVEVETAGGQALTVPTDVAAADQVAELGRRAVARFGRIDTWVNNAAVTAYGTFADSPPDEFRRVVEVNLVGTANGTRVALDHLRAEGGTIVNVASGLGERAVPLQAAYCASKFGVRGFSESVRVELEHDSVPVRLSVIKPASMDTPLFRHARTRMGVEPRPVPPVYDPELVAEAILYAATHPVRELAVGGASAGLRWFQQLSPRLLDAQLRVAGFRAQQEVDHPKGPEAGDNLEAASAGPGAVRGGYGGRRFSLGSWLGMHPAARRGAATGAAAVAGLISARSRR